MKLLFTSDLHGLDSAYSDFSNILRKGDYEIGVIAGDLMTFPSDKEMEDASEKIERSSTNNSTSISESSNLIVQLALTRKEIYYKRILRQSGKIVLFIMGNDDGILGDGSSWESNGLLVNVDMRRAKYAKYNFVGYQYTNPYVGGAFEKDEKEQEKDFLILETLIDENSVLITHGPPEGVLDLINEGEHVGSKALRGMVERRPPRLHLFGHIHQGFGIDGNSVNGSYPYSRKFFEVNVNTMEIKILER